MLLSFFFLLSSSLSAIFGHSHVILNLIIKWYLWLLLFCCYVFVWFVWMFKTKQTTCSVRDPMVQMLDLQLNSFTQSGRPNSVRDEIFRYCAIGKLPVEHNYREAEHNDYWLFRETELTSESCSKPSSQPDSRVVAWSWCASPGASIKLNEQTNNVDLTLLTFIFAADVFKSSHRITCNPISPYCNPIV